MKISTSLRLLFALGALMATGCNQTVRHVTNRTWFGTEELMVSTSEMKGNFLFRTWTARVISCKHQPDHSLVCTDQAELNRYLNETNTEKGSN